LESRSLASKAFQWELERRLRKRLCWKAEAARVGKEALALDKTTA
jgi:hypothetical protein